MLGRSRKGKTEWACSLFKNPLLLRIGSLTHFPEQMRNFKRGFHDGVVLDDLRDLRFLTEHQDRGTAALRHSGVTGAGRPRGRPASPGVARGCWRP